MSKGPVRRLREGALSAAKTPAEPAPTKLVPAVIGDEQAASRQRGPSFGLPGWVLKREAETFERLIRDHQVAIRRVAHSILTDPRDVEEAVADTFAKALKAWWPSRREASERTWLRRICLIVCVDKLRRRRADLAPLDPDLEPPAGADDPELPLALWQEINDLPLEWQVTFKLKQAGYSVTEISKLTGKPGKTVAGHYNAACERLRERLAGPRDEQPGEGS